MPRTLDEAERARDGRILLKHLGLTVSPEFGAALFAAPREKLVTGGWQAGKSIEGGCEILLDFTLWATQPREYRYWVIVPSYETPHKEADYLDEWAGQLGIRTGARFPQGGSVGVSMALPNGARIIVETKTAQNLAGIAGEPCDGVLVVEAGQIAEGVQEAAQGRVMTRRGWIVYTGTLEDDENTPRWAWYSERADEWQGNGTGTDERAFALPSWANLAIFPGGEQDPEIGRLRGRLDEYTFNRRIAARPSGVQNPIYPQLSKPLLKPMPAGLVWVDAAGGIDFGTQHPSSLTAVTLADNNDAWVRENVYLKGTGQGGTEAADSGLIEQHRDRMRDWYQVYRWGTDPNERHTANLIGATAVSGSQGARGGRIGLTTARLNETRGRLFYDANGPGVPELYREQKRVHYVKNGQGQLVVWRVADDRTASLEDAIEVLDGDLPWPHAWGSMNDPDGLAQRRQPVSKDTFPEVTPKSKQPETYGARRDTSSVGLNTFGGRRSR
jgi:hypothetical protein